MITISAIKDVFRYSENKEEMMLTTKKRRNHTFKLLKNAGGIFLVETR